MIVCSSALIVAIQAPHFLSISNLSQVTTLAAIIAIAAVGESLVIMTKNIDLSVESTIGLVAFVVADILRQKALPVPAGMGRRGSGWDSCSGWPTARSSRSSASRRSWPRSAR